MKRLALVLLLTLPVLADDLKPPVKPVVIAAPEQKAIADAYRTVVEANKDLQIAILRARIVCHVDESWNIDFQTMTFAPPAAPAAPVDKPKP